MNYCSHCGHHPLEFKIPEGDRLMRYICSSCGTIHYQNPKIIVGCLVLHEDKVLLCKRGIEPRKGYWNIPAGFMENGETLEQGARREVWEEAEAEVEIIRLHTIFNLPVINQVYFLYLAKLKGNHFGVGEESIDTALFDIDKIPYEELAFSSNKFALEAYLKTPNFQGVHTGEYIHKKK